MNRCQTAKRPHRSSLPCLCMPSRQMALLLMFLLAMLVTRTGYPQDTQRTFPTEALRGRLLVTQPPEVMLNGQPARLSPGARIRSEQNLLVLSGSLVGKERLVNYTRESSGLIRDIWILSASEAQIPREGLPLIGTLIPGPAADRLKVDDGRTPFEQLPTFKP